MPIHDAYARLTPYEILLPEPDFAEETFSAVADEAAERGSDLGDPDRFVMLMAVGEALRELRGPGEESERIRQHGALLYHAYHFRRAGEPVWLLSTPAARLVVEGSSGGREPARPPADAGYLQLPQHLFWGRAEGEAGAGGARGGGVDAGGEETAGGGDERARAEMAGERGREGDAGPSPQSLDGIFWTVADERIAVLAVLGVREDRPGFSVVPLPPLPLADAPAWAETDMRGTGGDFRSDMPGAELESLYEIRTAGELLKLLVRAFRLAEEGAGRVPPPRGPDAEGAPSGGPRPSGLPFHRITLD